MNIIDLFNKEELTERNDGNFKVECPNCGLQGGRTEGFILFPEKNTAYCHSSHKTFNLLECAALKLKIISCLEGRDSSTESIVSEELRDETYLTIRNEYGGDFLTDFKISCGDLSDFLIIDINSKGKIKRKANIDKISDYIISKYNIKTVYGVKNDSIYVYDDGIWTETGKGLIDSAVEDLMGIYSTNNVVNETREKIKRKTEITQKEFDIQPEYKRCFINGVLDFEDINNIKHIENSKEYNFKTRFPIEYNPEATCEKIFKFLNDSFYPDDLPQIQEWFGLHLSVNYIFKKAVIIQGEPNTGKTVFLNLLNNFLDNKNVSDLSLQQVSRGKTFDLLNLKDKYANIHDDLSSRDLEDGGGFKLCVGDSFISGEEKFGRFHNFRNSAKMTFACNKIPPVKDIDDEAYYDRFLIWIMDNMVDKKNMNPDLIKELTTKQELSCLLNFAIQGYIRLVKNNGFSNVKSSEQIKDMMVENGNPLARFVMETLEQSDGEKISKQDMYNQYCHYCNSQKPKLSPCTKDSLGKNLTRYAPFISDSHSGNERYWLNVKNNLCVKGTAGTPFQNLYMQKNNTIKNKKKDEDIIFRDVYQLSLENLPKLNKKVSENSVTKKIKEKNKTEKQTKLPSDLIMEKHIKGTPIPKTNREVQFWESKECENIKPTHTKEQLLEWLKKNPKATYKQMYEKWGDGCFKFRDELIEEGIIDVKEYPNI